MLYVKRMGRDGYTAETGVNAATLLGVRPVILETVTRNLIGQRKAVERKFNMHVYIRI